MKAKEYVEKFGSDIHEIRRQLDVERVELIKKRKISTDIGRENLERELKSKLHAMCRINPEIKDALLVN